MNVLDMQRHIKSKTFDKFYIFTGEDNSLMNNYIDKIIELLTVDYIDKVYY